jgi:dTDP-L-rhamnose 4-epimerase
MILVTGGAGFIGSHVVDALLERGEEVRIVDALLPAAHRERPDYLDPRAELIEGDLRDPEVARAAAVVGEVVGNQAGLLLGLPGGGRRREAARRAIEAGAR